MPADKDRADRMKAQAQNAFAKAIDSREFWNSLVHRDEKPVLDPKVTNVGYYMTPDLWDSEQNVIDILVGISTTRFDANVLQPGKHAEDAARDAKVWAARVWAMINNGFAIDKRNAAGIARHGFKVQRLRHEPITEPEYEDEEGYDESKSLDRRDEAMKKRGNVWSVEDVENLACAWLERSEHRTVFVYEADIPVLDAYDEFKVEREYGDGESKGKKQMRPSLDVAGTLIWVGDDEQPDKSVWEHTVKHVVVEYLDPENPCPVCPDKHPLWAGCEYLCGPNQAMKDAEEVYHYVLPYKYEPSFRVCGGRVSPLDKDPDTRYSPFLYKLLVEAAVINWCETMLMTLANRDSADERVYGSMARMTDAVANRIPEQYWEKMSIPLPDPHTNEVPLLPVELLKWPTEMAELFKEMSDAARQRFEAAKINRFLLGQNDAEVEQGSASANLQATQQAKTPFMRPLSEMDSFDWRLFADIFHAIKVWDHGVEEKAQQKFYVTTDGSEAIKGHVDAGESVYLNAAKLSYDFDLLIRTENDTEQEKMAAMDQAFALFDRGFIDEDELLERLGFHDTEAQKRKIAKLRILRRNLAMKESAQDYALRTIFSAVSGIPEQVLAAGQPQPVVAGRGNDTPSPTVRLPSLNPGGGGNGPPPGGGV